MARTSANDPKQTSRLVKILVNEDRASTIPAVWRHHKVPIWRLPIHLSGDGPSLTKTHGGSRECLVNRLLNAVEYEDANDRDNNRSNAGQ